MLGDRRRDVGFLAGNAGSMSGFWSEPDITFYSTINGLHRECRECQAFLVGEICGGIQKTAICVRGAATSLIMRDLNDAGS
jgi:hypothetical protein